MKPRQQGLSIAIVLVVLALLMVAFLATYALSRLTGSSDDRTTTSRRMQQAADLIEQFAASNGRLPCPASRTLVGGTEGAEIRTAGAKSCTEPNGVVPWQTIGLKKEDAYDAWGRRISYRVYSGHDQPLNRGSLTQDSGVSMVYCDSWETGTNHATDGNGLCVNTGTAESRTTSDVSFLAGKSLSLDDMGNVPAPANVAFLLVSHGASGLGGYTVSGVRVDPLPISTPERNNTEANGPFTLRAFSASTVYPRDAGHFDDLLVYRTLPDLVKRINLAARDWPDPPPPGSKPFNPTTLPTGVTVDGNKDTGQWYIDFGSVAVFGVIGGSMVANVSMDTIGSTGGIGVVGSSNPKMTYVEGEWLALLFDDNGTKFGITLNDFGTFTQSGTTMTENVTFVFFRDGTGVNIVNRAACRVDGGLASFDIDVGVTYNQVLILPAASTGNAAGTTVTGDTGFLVSEVRTCPSSAPNCRTGLSTAANSCS